MLTLRRVQTGHTHSPFFTHGGVRSFFSVCLGGLTEALEEGSSAEDEEGAVAVDEEGAVAVDEEGPKQNETILETNLQEGEIKMKTF